MTALSEQRAQTARGKAPENKTCFTALILCAAAAFLLFLPFFSWILIAQPDALYGAMKLSASVVKKLQSGYSVFTFLSFVQASKQGVLGFWAFLLLIAAAAAVIFCLLSFAAYLRRGRVAEGKGMLRTYSFLQKGLLFSFAAAAGTAGLCVYGNIHYGMTGFLPGISVYLVLALSACGYVISKRLEKQERIRCREHGFLEELRRNWILFLFLVPCFVFFLINNYLPMTGIYFAFIVRGTKYPERCAMILNYLMTDEDMNDLVQYGIKGVHYDVVDGVYKELSEDFRYENFNTWNLRVNDYKLPQESDVALQAMFDKYNEIAQKTKFPNVNIYGGFTEDYTDYEFERTAVSNVMRQYLAPIQAGLVDDVDAAVAEFRQKVTDAGLQACRDGFIEQWTAYCEEYGYQ